MKRLIVGLALLVLATAEVALAGVSETRAKATHGNCSVWTSVSMLTDKETDMLTCGKNGSLVAAVAMPNRDLLIAFINERMSHRDSTIPVEYRFDKGHLNRDVWLWIPGEMSAAVMSESLALTFLHELARGWRLAFKVGREGGHIALKGSAAAVRDFLARSGR